VRGDEIDQGHRGAHHSTVPGGERRRERFYFNSLTFFEGKSKLLRKRKIPKKKKGERRELSNSWWDCGEA
jgi:hypothetical protein